MRKKEDKFVNYGMNREIAALVLNSGCITNYDFYLMEDGGSVTKGYLNVYKKRLVDQDFLKEYKFKADGKVYRICRLSNFYRDKEILRKAFGDDVVEYYESQKEVVESNIKESVANKDPYRLLRAARKSFTALLMSKAYIRTYADDFDKNGILKQQNQIKENESCFLFMDEVKKTFSSKLATRAIGILINPNESYPVYTQAKARLQINDQEMRMRGLMYKVNTKLREVPITNNEYNAIIISEEKAIINMFEGPKAVKSIQMLSIPESNFNKFYYVPADTNGSHALGIMAIKDWEKRLRDKYLKDYDSPRKTWLTHHATKNDNLYIYLFCIPDLNGLYNFLTGAEEFLDELQFEILCFDYQLSLLRGLVDERIKITVVER